MSRSFARQVLRLEPMAALGELPVAALRGMLIHESIGRFLRAHPRTLPADAVLLSGRAAVRLMHAGAGRMAAGSRGELRGGEVEGRLCALVIREMNVRPVV
jgi:hypothetical protein